MIDKYKQKTGAMESVKFDYIRKYDSKITSIIIQKIPKLINTKIKITQQLKYSRITSVETER